MEAKQNMSINKKQTEILINFMSGNPDLAKGILKTAEGRRNSGFLWGKLANSLNTEGPPQKNFKDWKKTWSKLKYKVKNKIRTNKLHLKGTGGGPYMQKKIDELEEKNIECAGLEAAVEGVPAAKSFGATYNDSNNSTDTNKKNAWDDVVLDKENLNRMNDFKENLMVQYVKAAETINIKLDAIHEVLCSSQKTQKRRLEVEEKQYRLKKKKLDIYERNEVERLRLQEKMLTTKIEENQIRLRELDT